MRAVSLVNLVASGNRRNQVRERMRVGVLTRAKGSAYVSPNQEEKSVETTEANLTEGICSIADDLKRSIPWQNFLTFRRFQQRPGLTLLAAEDL